MFKCLVNRDTEYCRVGKESVLITMGYNSALLQFKSHAGKYWHYCCLAFVRLFTPPFVAFWKI